MSGTSILRKTFSGSSREEWVRQFSEKQDSYHLMSGTILLRLRTERPVKLQVVPSGGYGLRRPGLYSKKSHLEYKKKV